MSQHRFNVSSNYGIIDVFIGWDPPLKCFFLVIDYNIDSADEPLYSNLYEDEPFLLTLEYIQTILEQFEITDINVRPESELYNNLMKDKELGI